MPILVETNRKMSKRRIYIPGATNADRDAYVEYKVIDEITFKVQEEFYQEYTFKFYNDKENKGRIVVVKIIGGHKVERIKSFGVVSPEQQNQVFAWAILGWEDPEGDGPDIPEVHLETHEFTAKNPDNGMSATFQRIDKMSIIVKEEQNQEYEYHLKWPDDDNDDTSRADTSSDFSDINPPYRMDPFQTLIERGLYMVVLTKSSVVVFPMDSLASPDKMKPIYKGSHSAGFTDFFMTCQVPSGTTGVTPIMSAVKFAKSGTKTKVTASDTQNIFLNSNPRDQKSTRVKKMSTPTIACSPDGSKLYSPDGIFNLNTKKKTLSRSGNTPGGYVEDNTCCAVFPDGRIQYLIWGSNFQLAAYYTDYSPDVGNYFEDSALYNWAELGQMQQFNSVWFQDGYKADGGMWINIVGQGTNNNPAPFHESATLNYVIANATKAAKKVKSKLEVGQFAIDGMHKLDKLTYYEYHFGDPKDYTYENYSTAAVVASGSYSTNLQGTGGDYTGEITLLKVTYSGGHADNQHVTLHGQSGGDVTAAYDQPEVPVEANPYPNAHVGSFDHDVYASDGVLIWYYHGFSNGNVGSGGLAVGVQDGSQTAYHDDGSIYVQTTCVTTGSYTGQHIEPVQGGPPREKLGMICFPYSVDKKTYFSIETSTFDEPTWWGTTWRTSSIKHYTPYGVIDKLKHFFPWMHVQNDQHILQGFGFNEINDMSTINVTDKQLYLNGKDATSKIVGAVGAGSVDDIVAIFFDFSLSDAQGIR